MKWRPGVTLRWPTGVSLSRYQGVNLSGFSIEEVEKKLTKETNKKEELSIKVSKLDDEFNDKNLRKLKLNFEDLKEDAEQAIIQFLTE
ncbi:MAG: hypothetical protein ACOYBY_18325, partial [Dermatophilaceae bacterium]